MIFWTGNGIAVPFFFVGAYTLAETLTGLTLGKEFADKHTYDWVPGIGLLFGSAFCWLLVKHSEKSKSRVLIDKATGKEITFRPSNTFMFVPIRWFVFIGLLLGIAIFFFGIPDAYRSSHD